VTIGDTACPCGETETATTIPAAVADTLLRALTWSGDQITQEEREAAWAWVDARNERQEDMGG
jgi:hypothetical protein